MSVKDVAEGLVTLCRAGKYDEASATYHADDIVSVEAMGPPGADLASRGRAAVEAKSKWWTDNHEIIDGTVEGPFLNGDQFSVRFAIDVKVKATGAVHHMSEIALYTVKNDKVVEERFFYGI